MRNNAKGYLGFVLHTHLPYVLSHGVWPHGSDWLNEAACECYIPILDILYTLKRKGEQPKLTIGITPVLQEQLKHQDFISGLRSYLEDKKNIALDNERFFSKLGDKRARLARAWYEYYSKIETLFNDDYNCDILKAFSNLQKEGIIEIITSAATHGYLPLLGNDNSVYAQIQIGVQAYERNFGVRPKGIWLPECAYRPGYTWINPIYDHPVERKGIEEILKRAGINYFIVDTPLIAGGKAVGVYIERYEALKKLWQQFEKAYKPLDQQPRTVYRPYLCGEVSVFGRDPKTALQVWSGEWGYPGNGVYLDFHKKHWPGGLRYWRVTNPKADLGEKVLYEPDAVEGVLFEQAEHFTNLCKSILEKHYIETGLEGIIVAPYDTELFGHWWFEGPRWLAKVLTNFNFDTRFSTITLGEYLERYPAFEIIALPEGSWGEGGFHYIWFNDWTKWSWKLIYDAEQKFVEWANKLEEKPEHNLSRILAQAARELLLLESSDWQFLISTWSARDYAEQRISCHYESFKEIISLAETYEKNSRLSDSQWDRLIFYETRDPIFPDLDPLLWASKRLG